MAVAVGSSAREHRANRDPICFTIGERTIRMDPSEGTETFETIDEPAGAYTNTLTTGQLPGFGESYDTCGNPMPHFCADCGIPARDDDGDLVEIGQTCWRKECPRCAPGWAMRAATPIVSKMESLRKDVAAHRGESPKFHHVSITIPDEEGEFSTARNDPDDIFFELAKTIIEEVGVNVYGGALVHHSFSGNQDEDDDRGRWKERLFEGREWDGDVRKELRERHHIHAFVLADSIDHYSCEAVYEQTGIVTRRIEKRDEDTNVSLFGVEDLADGSTYALSHARDSDSADAYRYFGEVANHSADHRIEARCREVVRSVVPKTLGITPSDLLCDDDLDEDDVDHQPDTSQYTGSGDGDGDGSGGTPTTTDTETTTCCNGRLVPFEYAPSMLEDDDRDLNHADELRRAYESWDPPD